MAGIENSPAKSVFGSHGCNIPALQRISIMIPVVCDLTDVQNI
jgi:hypothetical protein